MKLFEMYSPKGEHVEILLESGNVIIRNILTGDEKPWNDCYYEESAYSLIHFSLVAEGYTTVSE